MAYRSETLTLHRNGKQKSVYFEQAFAVCSGFQGDIVEQVLIGGKTPSQVSKDTGINLNSLYGWIRHYKAAQKETLPFSGNGKVSSLEEQIVI